MNELENRLAGFQATSLEEIGIVKLLKRYDTKFIFHRDHLRSVFDYLSQHYEILEIDNKRFFKYQNLYFDTDDYFFYHQHHNKNFSRYKVRYRKYIESGQCYFEVKLKSNKKKTIKSRLLLENKNISNELSDKSKEFARDRIFNNNGEIIERIRPKLWVEFDRITFANRHRKERLTIDVNLAYRDNISQYQKIDNLIIAELKSEKISINSQLFRFLKGLKIFPARFSKYCIGIALTEDNIKCNRFKKKILKLRKLN